MLEKFLGVYRADGDAPDLAPYAGQRTLEPALVQVLAAIGGRSFNDGIYRTCTFEEVDLFTDLAEEYFPEMAGQVQVFAYDWLGRLFALDQSAGAGAAESEVMLLETGVGEALEIPFGIVAFHDQALVEHADDALARPFFQDWRKTVKAPLSREMCAGYQVPLFLGGEDLLANLEVIDVGVYVSLCAQLYNQTIEMEDGQTIKSVSVE